MTSVLNRFIFGTEEDEHIVKDWHDLAGGDFKDYITRKLEPYIGKTTDELMETFGVTRSKSYTYHILSNMLGIEGSIAKSEEFKKAGIVPKNVVVSDHVPRESMSFPAFKFKELVEETWEESTLKNQLEPTIFMFTVFEEIPGGRPGFRNCVFRGIKFWNIPAEDLEEVRQVWEHTVKIIREGVELIPEGNRIRNNLPKQTESRVAHVRPHARNRSDTDTLPDGREMTKQSFWLNRDYVASIIEGVVDELGG